jgi:hypothetical protein
VLPCIRRLPLEVGKLRGLAGARRRKQAGLTLELPNGEPVTLGVIRRYGEPALAGPWHTQCQNLPSPRSDPAVAVGRRRELRPHSVARLEKPAAATERNSDERGHDWTGGRAAAQCQGYDDDQDGKEEAAAGAATVVRCSLQPACSHRPLVGIMS